MIIDSDHFVFSEMQYLVHFYCDKQVVIMNEKDMLLDEFDGFSLEDWRNTGPEECRVNVIYGEEEKVYTACILQVSFSSLF